MKIAVLFPGYGSQFVGMGKDLYDSSRIMQEYFEEASNCLNINFVKLCFASSDAELGKIEQALVAHFLVSSSIYAVVKDQVGIVPDTVAGHTSGRYAAVFAAGGMNFPDMLYLLQKYALFYQELLTTVPVKVVRLTGISRPTLETVIKELHQGKPEDLYIAVYESDLVHVLVMNLEQADGYVEHLYKAGAKKIVERAMLECLYSGLMQPVEVQLRLYSEKVDFKDLAVPLLTGTTAASIQAKGDIKEELLRQLLHPYHWSAMVRQLEPYDLLVEIGPGMDLTKALRKRFAGKKVIAVNKESDIQELQNAVSSPNKNDVPVSES